MKTDSDPKKQAERLLAFLRESKDDRGMMAELRSGLDPEREHRAWPHLASFGGCSEGHIGGVVRTVSALFALQPDLAGGADVDFGAVWRALAIQKDKKDAIDPKSSYSKHLMHCLAAQRDEICSRVSRLARRALGGEIRWDPVRLFCDLIYWSPRVRGRWANSFWGEDLATDLEAELEP